MINVEVFGAGIVAPADSLEGWCGWAAQYLDWKAEMESQTRDSYYL